MNLSKREVEMVQDLLKGFAAKEIAHRNYISPHTVNTHFKTIKQKLSAKNNVEVAVKYLANLKDPAAYLKQLAIAIFFIGIQGTTIINNFDIELRRVSTRTVRTVRTARKHTL